MTYVLGGSSLSAVRCYEVSSLIIQVEAVTDAGEFLCAVAHTPRHSLLNFLGSITDEVMLRLW